MVSLLLAMGGGTAAAEDQTVDDHLVIQMCAHSEDVALDAQLDEHGMVTFRLENCGPNQSQTSNHMLLSSSIDNQLSVEGVDLNGRFALAAGFLYRICPVYPAAEDSSRMMPCTTKFNSNLVSQSSTGRCPLNETADTTVGQFSTPYIWPDWMDSCLYPVYNDLNVNRTGKVTWHYSRTDTTDCCEGPWSGEFKVMRRDSSGNWIDIHLTEYFKQFDILVLDDSYQQTTLGVTWNSSPARHPVGNDELGQWQKMEYVSMRNREKIKMSFLFKDRAYGHWETNLNSSGLSNYRHGHDKDTTQVTFFEVLVQPASFSNPVTICNIHHLISDPLSESVLFSKDTTTQSQADLFVEQRMEFAMSHPACHAYYTFSATITRTVENWGANGWSTVLTDVTMISCPIGMAYCADHGPLANQNPPPSLILEGDWEPEVYLEGNPTGTPNSHGSHSPLYRVTYDYDYCYRQMSVSCNSPTSPWGSGPHIGTFSMSQDVVVL